MEDPGWPKAAPRTILSPTPLTLHALPEASQGCILIHLLLTASPSTPGAPTPHRLLCPPTYKMLPSNRADRVSGYQLAHTSWILANSSPPLTFSKQVPVFGNAGTETSSWSNGSTGNSGADSPRDKRAGSGAEQDAGREAGKGGTGASNLGGERERNKQAEGRSQWGRPPGACAPPVQVAPGGKGRRVAEDGAGHQVGNRRPKSGS